MSEFQDIDGDVGELEAVEQQHAAQQDDTADLPEKYKGKSVAEVARMHQEAEKLIDRQGREVHEVRQLADELIKSQLSSPKKVADEPKEIDFFENPQEAIRQQIENNPRVIAVEQYAKQVQAEQSKQRIAAMHPDMNDVVTDVGFQTWVKASKVRQQLYQQADNYDVDAANELLSTYKELRSVRQKQVEVADNTARDKALSAAAVETGGSGESSKKMYRRADLIRLKIRDPNKYEAMSDEILEAYRSGRVK